MKEAQDLLPSNATNLARLPPLVKDVIPLAVQSEFRKIFGSRRDPGEPIPFSALSLNPKLEQSLESKLKWKNMTFPQAHGIPAAIYGQNVRR